MFGQMMKGITGGCVCFLLLVHIGGMFADEFGGIQELPVSGKQVLQKINLPVGEGTWSAEKGEMGENFSAEGMQTSELSYWIFLPTDRSEKKRRGYPLILFLHGSGERGNPEAVKTYGPPYLVETEKGEEWPFITVSPVCPKNQKWSADQLLFLLDEIVRTQPVDTTRIYLTGVSMGGYGTWALLDRAGEYFAAAAPICGGCDPAKASKMLDIPLWIFHGEADPVVPPARSIGIQNAIEELGGKKSQLTLYPGVGHNCWVETYDNPELYNWFLKQNLRKR